ARSAGWTPSTAVEALSDGPVGAVSHAELGKVNAWRSAGPLLLPLRPDRARVQVAVDTRPDLRTGPGILAVEVVVDSCRPLWCGIETGADAGRIAQLLDIAH
ncbi:MAG: hypothetical protein ACRCZP_15310, partial [Phycicoccus sp.]